MACRVCTSDNQENFPGEMNVGFPGLTRVSLYFRLYLREIIGLLGLRTYGPSHPCNQIRKTEGRYRRSPFSGCVTDRSTLCVYAMSKIVQISRMRVIAFCYE